MRQKMANRNINDRATMQQARDPIISVLNFLNTTNIEDSDVKV